jgi:hypothetical protein
MGKDILNEFGPNSYQPQAGSASSGGRQTPKDVMNYSPPQGPKGIMQPQTPGLHGTNSGVTNQPTSLQRPANSSGIGGINHGCCGSQGKY